MFFNISNHPSQNWGEEQISAAKKLGGKIVDIPFPNIDPNFGSDDIWELGQDILDIIQEFVSGISGHYFMIQGEFSLCYQLFKEISQFGGRVVVATTERKVVETVNPNGTVSKTAQFKFVQFRKV